MAATAFTNLLPTSRLTQLCQRECTLLLLAEINDRLAVVAADAGEEGALIADAIAGINDVIDSVDDEIDRVDATQ